MLKIFVITALVAAFVLFAAMVGMIAFSSEQSEPDDHAKPAVAENSNSNDRKSVTDKAAANDRKEAKQTRDWYYVFIDHPTDWLLVLFNGLLVLATIALFVSGEKSVDAARRSARAANRSAQIAEDSIVKLQRAFVTFRGVQFLSHTDTEGKVWWSLHFNWFNSGASPAKRVKFFAARYFEDVDIPADFKFEIPTDRPTNFMGPQSPMQTTGLAVTVDDLLAVRENKKFLYFWGRADYRDIFDESPDHVTKFSVRVRDFRGDPAKEWDSKSNIVEIIMDNSPARHNCADEDCDSQ